MPPSSLYWIQKSASSSSSAAGKRSSAASPGERLPLASAARMLLNSPAPTVPAPRAIVLPKKERRLMNRFRGLLFSKLSSRGRFSRLLEPFAVGLIVVFMRVESHRFALRAAREKLHVRYRARQIADCAKRRCSLRCSNPLSKVRDVAQFRHKYAVGGALRVKMQISHFARIAQNYAVRLSEFVRKPFRRF